MGDRPRDRLGRWETLGAWLGFWTPPREAEVPPVPWRRIGLGAVVLVLVLGVAAAIVVPQVSENRQEARERQQRADAERHAAFLETVDREQRPRRGGGRPDPGSGAAPSRRTVVRTNLAGAAEAGIAADAEQRGGKDVRGVECEPFPRQDDDTMPARDLSRPAAAYDCVAVTARLKGDSEGIIGMPFRLVVRFDEGRFAWCRIVPLGDRDRLAHPLPGACRLEAPS
jgi:type II secretory pathway pseudopilin PulG